MIAVAGSVSRAIPDTQFCCLHFTGQFLPLHVLAHDPLSLLLQLKGGRANHVSRGSVDFDFF
jgi:hypothetical protein